jgi:hypothetical protein
MKKSTPGEIVQTADEAGQTGLDKSRQSVRWPALPPALGVALDVGFLASLAIVLAGCGTAGLWCGIGIGALSVAGVAARALSRLQRPAISGAAPALAVVRVRAWGDGADRAA